MICIAVAATARAKRRLGEAQHRNAKLTDDAVREIRNSTDRGVDLARRFGISPATVCYVRKGVGWKHIKGGDNG